MQRYISISSQYLFAPLAVETSGVIGPAATRFIKELGHMLTAATGDQRETAWLWQRVSMAIIRGNAAAIRGSAPQTALNSAVTYSHCRPAGDWQMNPPPAADRLYSSPALSPASTISANFPSKPPRERTNPGSNSLVMSSSDVISQGATRQSAETASPSEAAEQAACSPAVLHSVQPSRNPLDDPELARYLLPRAPLRLTDPDVPTSQELTDQLLYITPSSPQTPGPPRPDALAVYAALLAEMSEGVHENGDASELT